MKKIDLSEAAKFLIDGALILACLDDTISLICDARSKDTVALLRKLKNRSMDKGFTILMDSDARVNKYIKDVPPLAWDIFDTSDNPIILILPGGQNMAINAMAEDKTVAVRMVSLSERKLVQAANGPLASTALLKTDGSLATSLDDADPALLDEVDYVLTLPPETRRYSSKKIPIISLDLDNNVKIIRD